MELKDEMMYAPGKCPGFQFVRCSTTTTSFNYYFSPLNWVECFAWESQAYAPRLFADENDASNTAHIRNQIVLRKEVFEYVGSMWLIAIGEKIQRLEFGSLANNQKFYSLKLCPSTPENMIYNTCFNLYDVSIQKKFFGGDCVGLVKGKNSFMCEVCLMHQYGLHRTKDKTRQICESGSNPNTPIQDCFWSELSDELTTNKSGQTFKSNLANFTTSTKTLCPPVDLTEIEKSKHVDHEEEQLDPGSINQKSVAARQSSATHVAASTNSLSLLVYATKLLREFCTSPIAI